MKPIVSEAWIVATEEVRSGPIYLCRGRTLAAPYVVTHDLGCATRFTSRDAADEARSLFEERQRGSGHGAGGWTALRAVTTTKFSRS